MHNGLSVVAYNLKDVGPYDGGFGCVPGSHKSNYGFPDEWKEMEEPGPLVERVTGPAGTAIIFTEALTHGTLPWAGADERRTIFFKYSPHSVSWSADYFDRRRLPKPHGRSARHLRRAECAVSRQTLTLTCRHVSRPSRSGG